MYIRQSDFRTPFRYKNILRLVFRLHKASLPSPWLFEEKENLLVFPGGSHETTFTLLSTETDARSEKQTVLFTAIRLVYWTLRFLLLLYRA